MKYWAFLPKTKEGSAVLSAVPGDGPRANKYRKGKPLKGIFPGIEDAVMCFDPNYPDGIKLQKIIKCLDGVWVVHKEVKALFEFQGINEEFLQVRLWDHQNIPVSDDYYIFNCLALVDFVDLEKSRVAFCPFFPDRINNIVNLAINPKLDTQAKIFAPINMTEQLFISDDFKQVLENAGIDDFKAFEAQGWDGLSV